MSKYLHNKKVNSYRKCLQSERKMKEESKKAPVTAAERMWRMRQCQKVEASTSCADAATPNVTFAETFENRDLAFITHWHRATEHFEKSFYGNKLGFVCGVCDRRYMVPK